MAEKYMGRKLVAQVVTVLSQIPEQYEQNEWEIGFRNDEYNDLTHALELTNFGGVQGYKLAKALKENRLKRREAKDANELMKPLYDLIKRHPKLLSEFKQCMGEIDRITHEQKNRLYRPRVPDSPLLEVFAGRTSPMKGGECNVKSRIDGNADLG